MLEASDQSMILTPKSKSTPQNYNIDMTHFSSLPKLCARRTVTRSSELGESFPDIPLVNEFLQFFTTQYLVLMSNRG